MKPELNSSIFVVWYIFIDNSDFFANMVASSGQHGRPNLLLTSLGTYALDE